MALNYLTETIGKAYDHGGALAASGKSDGELLQHLLDLNTQQQSLGREWFEQHFLPILNTSTVSLNDKLATCAEYMVFHISSVLKQENLNSVLITGGGAYNTFLIDRLKANYNGEIHIPSDDVIQFKEAIIFAYLGFLRVNEQINTLNSVTKASRDSVGGAVYLGRK
jgi:anhydro-N-acetylmuramic acid kinase